MKKYTVEYEIYTFDELSEASKAKAISGFVQNMSKDDFDYSLLIDNFIEEAEEYGIYLKPENISWSGFGCQGDGASFTTNDIDIEKFIEKAGISFKKKSIKAIFMNADKSPSIYRTDFHYLHKNTVSAASDIQFYVEDTHPRVYKEICNMEMKVDGTLETIKNILCENLYHMLEEEYFYRTSKEYVAEIFRDSESLFFENGNVFEKEELNIVS